VKERNLRKQEGKRGRKRKRKGWEEREEKGPVLPLVGVLAS
jgi:hypothetical protein